MDENKNIGLSNVEVEYGEKIWKIFLFDIFIPIVFVTSLFFFFRQWLGPYIIELIYTDFDFSRNPEIFPYIKLFFFDYFQWISVLIFLLIFGKISYTHESIPGPGRLLKVVLRKFAKRSKLEITEESEDHSHPGLFDYKSKDVGSLKEYFSGEFDIKDEDRLPYIKDSSNSIIGYLNPFDSKLKKNMKFIVLEREQRCYHTAVIGASGSGKTVSYIGPNLVFDSLNPTTGTFTLNPKGDYKLKKFAFIGIHKNYLITKKFKNMIQVVSFSDRKNSLAYDPFLFGNEIASSLDITNKLVDTLHFTEPYYKTQASDFVSKFSRIMATEEKLKFHLTLRHLVYYLGNPKAISFLSNYISGQTNLELLNSLASKNPEHLGGFYSHLSTFVDNEDLSFIFDDFSRPFLNLIDTVQNSGNVFVEVDTQSKTAVSQSFGKMLILDLQVLGTKRDSAQMPMDNFIAVNLDEFGSFAYNNVINFLDKARSSQFMISLAFQDLGNLETQGLDRAFRHLVLGNTTNKFFFTLSDDRAAKYASDLMGDGYFITKDVTHSTTQNSLADSQMGSKGVRFSKKLLPYVLPDQFMHLKKGQAYVRVSNEKVGSVHGSASIGLYPDDEMPSEEEVRDYMKMSYEASLRHPGAGSLLPITEKYDPYKCLRTNEILMNHQEPVKINSELDVDVEPNSANNIQTEKKEEIKNEFGQGTAVVKPLPVEDVVKPKVENKSSFESEIEPGGTTKNEVIEGDFPDDEDFGF